MDEPGVRLHGAQGRDGDGADGADAAEVVAHQVDDHHVLRVILLLEVGPGAARALDGTRLDGAPVAAQIELGEAVAISMPWAGSRTVPA